MKTHHKRIALFTGMMFTLAAFVQPVLAGDNDNDRDHHQKSDNAIVGPQGPIGLTGPAGPQGPVGPQGPTGTAVACSSGDMVQCYEGPVATLNVGPCRSGVRTCSQTGAYGACIGQQLPATEVFQCPSFDKILPLLLGFSSNPADWVQNINTIQAMSVTDPNWALYSQLMGLSTGQSSDPNCDGIPLNITPQMAHQCILTDKDGDGFSMPFDCNDNNSFINPGAVEICGDGLDNNCDGQIDETCGTPPVCPDRDQDGYTDAACGGADCNDADPTINPGAPEICGDGIDNNCNGLVDENCGAPSGAACVTGATCASGVCLPISPSGSSVCR